MLPLCFITPSNKKRDFYDLWPHSPFFHANSCPSAAAHFATQTSLFSKENIKDGGNHFYCLIFLLQLNDKDTALTLGEFGFPIIWTAEGEMDFIAFGQSDPSHPKWRSPTACPLSHYLTHRLEINFTTCSPFVFPQHNPALTHPLCCYCFSALLQF